MVGGGRRVVTADVSRRRKHGAGRIRARRMGAVLAGVVASAGLASAMSTTAAVALPSNCTGTTTVTCTFSYNGTDGTDGSVQTFDVPSNVTSVTIDALGASGESDSTQFYTAGGLGGHAAGTIPVTPSSTLQVYVGGTPTTAAGSVAGGYNGGGAGWTGGGGASDVRTGSDLDDRIVVAGGGGGGAMSAGGAGGGVSGAAPPTCTGTACPTGGTSSAGGSAGNSAGCTGGASVSRDTPAAAGAAGFGGTGEDVWCFEDALVIPVNGAGGGGGYYGGGGGGAGGTVVDAIDLAEEPAPGAGGSGYVTGSASDPVDESGVNSGNGQVTITYTPDTTAPSASPTQSPTANSNGWNNTDVTVNWNWADNTGGSGIDTGSCTTESTSSGEGLGLSLSASCNDLAGNTGSATYSVNVDKTAPSLAPLVSPNPVLLGGSATASPNATDGLSGVASSSCDPVATSAPGTQTVSCTATDNAGNTASTDASYVVGYDVLHTNPKPGTEFRPGTTVPVAFQLSGANGQPITNVQAAVLGPCAATVTYPGDAPTCATYSPTDHYFHANLATPSPVPLGVAVHPAINVSVAATTVATGSLALDPVPSLRVADATTLEGNHGFHNLAVRISLNGDSAQPVRFDWATAPGTAHSPSDYIGRAGTATIPGGHTSIVEKIAIRGDVVKEPNETFTVFVWNVGDAMATKPIGTCVIINDD